MNIPFWEETYQNDNIFTFGPEPNASLVEVQKFLEFSDNIIDVGCGDGHNVLYLAKEGYKNIDAFDISENAIAKLHRIVYGYSTCKQRYCTVCYRPVAGW